MTDYGCLTCSELIKIIKQLTRSIDAMRVNYNDMKQQRDSWAQIAESQVTNGSPQETPTPR